MTLNFFFDVDGTLLPVGKPIPQSAKDALLKAQRLGHHIFLSTGRSVYELPKEIKDIPFDGGVLSAGADVMFHNQTVLHKVATKEQKEAFFSVADKYHLLWLIQTTEASFSTVRGQAYHEELTMSVHHRKANFPPFKLVDRFPMEHDLSKAYIMSEDGLVLEARKELEGLFHCVNNTTGLPEVNAAEVMVTGISKSAGIQHMIDYLGSDITSTVGVGDGENDLDMIDYCHLGIAMGNSCEVLKQHADYVARDINDDGLADAIEYALSKI